MSITPLRERWPQRVMAGPPLGEPANGVRDHVPLFFSRFDDVSGAAIRIKSPRLVALQRADHSPRFI
jgi:hypothetical protein